MLQLGLHLLLMDPLLLDQPLLFLQLLLLLLLLQAPLGRQQGLLERLQQIRPRHRDDNVDVVYDEQRLVLHLVREVRQVVRQIQHLRQTRLGGLVELLQKRLDDGSPLLLRVPQYGVQKAIQRRRILAIADSHAPDHRGLLLQYLLEPVAELDADLGLGVHEARVLLLDVLELLVGAVAHGFLAVRAHADEVGHYRDGVHETLGQDELDDLEGGVPDAEVGVEERLEDLLEVELDDGAGHARGDVAHLLEVLLLGQLGPLEVLLDHALLLLGQVELDVLQDLR